jgi:hypothetical protein
MTQNAVHETTNIHGGTTWGLIRTIGQELGGMQIWLFVVCLFISSKSSRYHAAMHNVRFHIVDVGTREDMRLLVNLMASNYCENECMIRNNELFVSRLFPLSPEITQGDTNDKIIYPNICTKLKDTTLTESNYLNPADKDSPAFRLLPAQNAQLNSMSFHTYDVPAPEQDQISIFYLILYFYFLF